MASINPMVMEDPRKKFAKGLTKAFVIKVEVVIMITGVWNVVNSDMELTFVGTNLALVQLNKLGINSEPVCNKTQE